MTPVLPVECTPATTDAAVAGGGTGAGAGVGTGVGALLAELDADLAEDEDADVDADAGTDTGTDPTERSSPEPPLPLDCERERTDDDDTFDLFEIFCGCFLRSSSCWRDRISAGVNAGSGLAADPGKDAALDILPDGATPFPAATDENPAML